MAAKPVIDYFVKLTPEEGQPPLYMGLSSIEEREVEERKEEGEEVAREFIKERLRRGPFILAVQYEASGLVAVYHRGGETAGALEKGKELADIEPEQFEGRIEEVYTGAFPFQ
jgi:hypothetical protein